VRSIDSGHYIVFTTAHPEFALEGFKLNAIDYLLKPFSYEEFMKATQKVISLVDLVERCHAAESAIAQNEAEAADKEVISVKADYKTQLVKVADIVYLESAGEYVRLHLADGTKLVTLFRLKNMENALQSSQFMRVHRSYIVNLSHVAGYARGEVFLDSGDRVPLSVNYRDAFREYIDRKHPSQR
jgi:two-component system LytT family response regulator